MNVLFSFPFQAMATECVLHLYATDLAAAERAANATMAEVSRIEYRYSRYRSDSFLSGINRAALSRRDIELDHETATLIDYAFACHRISGGLFDVTSGPLRHAWNFTSGRLPTADEIDALLPRIGMDKLEWEPPKLGFRQAGMEIDLGGLGKEYAADRAAVICREHGIERGLINLGGDLVIIGPHPDGSPWQIGLRAPRRAGEAMAWTEVSEGALATSGDYERFMEIGGQRYCHILNPTTGWPAEGLQATTVLAGQCLLAGSLATAAMLKGNLGPDWLESLDRVDFLCVDNDGRLHGNLPLVTGQSYI